MNERTKVVFDLKKGELPYETESVWAERLSENQFRILNSPFFAFGVSYEDEIEAEPDGDRFRFVKVLRRSGRSTYRVILQGGMTISDPEFIERWKAFREAGCTYENANDKYISIDMAPTVDVASMYSLLEDGENDGVWVFEEGYFAAVEN